MRLRHRRRSAVLVGQVGVHCHVRIHLVRPVGRTDTHQGQGRQLAMTAEHSGCA